MTKERLSMRKIKEVLRLKIENKVSGNQISDICGIGRATVQSYLLRFDASGLKWPLADDLSDEEIEAKLFPGNKTCEVKKEELHYVYFIEELMKPDVTLGLLWTEYKQANTDGYEYSYFCELIHKYRRRLNYSMRQEHKAGEKGFIDFCEGLKIVDPITGEMIPTKLYIFVWGASNYTYVEASYGEDLESWIKLNVKALEYFGCCPKVCVPDNLKSGVKKACRYEPEINPTYAEFAAHYGTVIMPARPYKPKDKAKVEAGVRIVKRWILARLRNRIFTNLPELNEAIWELLADFNKRPLRKINKSRQELFEIWDKPNALPLPEKQYEYAEWDNAKVNINYHIEFDDNNYSVPYTLIHQKVDIRATYDIVEIYLKSKRIYAHRRSYKKKEYLTVKDHMPPAHQKHLEWTPERILEWAGKYGAYVKELSLAIMAERKYPQQAYKSCLGLIRLQRHYSAERLNAACKRALEYRIYSYQGVKNILNKKIENVPCHSHPAAKGKIIQHENIRGGEYYDQQVLNI